MCECTMDGEASMIMALVKEVAKNGGLQEPVEMAEFVGSSSLLLRKMRSELLLKPKLMNELSIEADPICKSNAKI